jgi:hypothetical protein
MSTLAKVFCKKVVVMKKSWQESSRRKIILAK